LLRAMGLSLKLIAPFGAMKLGPPNTAGVSFIDSAIPLRG